MMKFIVDDNIPYIKRRLEAVGEVRYVDQFGFTPEIVSDADALIIRTRTQCNQALLGESKARLVATATIGTDQIDIPWCESRGIRVRNSPGCNAPGVAQYVWSSLLRLGMKPGVHTIGVVGHGNVGTIVAEWGRKMGFEVLLCDPPKAEAELKLGTLTKKANAGGLRVGTPQADALHRADAGGLRKGIGEEEYLALEEVLRRSDAVTLHTPLVRGGEHPTFHLINSDNVGLLKKGAILVNAARGPVVATEAFLAAIGNGVTAVVDTWEGEPELNRELLDKAEIGTFHIAGYSREGKERATRMVLEAVEDTFGVEVDKSGLAPAWKAGGPVTAERITESYDPYVDDRALRGEPEAFDRLRANYDYRDEPKF